MTSSTADLAFVQLFNFLVGEAIASLAIALSLIFVNDNFDPHGEDERFSPRGAAGQYDA